jgi:hypothetical protein
MEKFSSEPRYQLFPRSVGMTKELEAIGKCFEKVHEDIKSAKHNLNSDNTYLESGDFQRVHTFLETLYISNRLVLPLKGIVLVGHLNINN